MKLVEFRSSESKTVLCLHPINYQKSHTMRTLIMLILLAVHCISSAQGFDIQALEDLLDATEKEDTFMGTLSIFSDGKEVFNSSRGYASISDKKPLTSESIYRIGSVTKIYTATIVLQMIEEGKLTLDTKLSQFFPQILNSQTITIKNLLKHESGLFNITDDPDFTKWMYEEQTREDMLKRIVSHGAESEACGDTAYSNTNFILLAYIAEDIDGTHFSEIINNRIAKKIQLQTTAYGGEIEYNKQHVFSHHDQEGSWELDEKYTDMSCPSGAGAIISTATEVGEFMTALMEHNVISSSNFDLMTDVSSGMGMGLGGVPLMNMKAYGMSGGIDGFSSLAIFFPEQKTSFTLLTNAAQSPLQETMMEVLKIYFK